MIVLLVCFTVLLVGDILIDASSNLFDIHYDTTQLQGFKHGKNMYISIKFESRHGPYNIYIDVHIVAMYV